MQVHLLLFKKNKSLPPNFLSNIWDAVVIGTTKHHY